MTIKRVTAVVLAMLLAAALFAGCGKDPDVDVYQPDLAAEGNTAPGYESNVSDTQPTTDPWGTDPWDMTEPATETSAGASAATSIKGPETVISYVYVTATTTKPAATAKPATTKKTTTTTKKTPTIPGTLFTFPEITTAKKASTTTKKATTGNYANPINIGSKDAALSAFNAAISKVLSGKAGFNKSHMITYKDWYYDPALLEGLDFPGLTAVLGAMGDPRAYITAQLNSALNKGIHSATAYKGDATGATLMRNSGFAMGDLKNVTYSGMVNGNWTITLTVNDGETRQEKKFLGSGISGNSPIDKGPLHMATGDASIYDHMTADRVFSLIKSQLSFINADPIDISESTSQVKFVATLDGGGALQKLQATYNQTINLKEIKIMNGAESYVDNTGSSTVSVIFDKFVY